MAAGREAGRKGGADESEGPERSRVTSYSVVGL